MGRPLITAGKLDRRLAILRRAAAADDGFTTQPGALQRLCWRYASVKPVRRREFLETAEVRGLAELSAWLRYDSVTSTILATDLVSFEGRVFQIAAAPLEVGRREGIELLLVSADDQVAVDPDSLVQWA